MRGPKLDIIFENTKRFLKELIGYDLQRLVVPVEDIMLLSNGENRCLRALNNVILFLGEFEISNAMSNFDKLMANVALLFTDKVFEKKDLVDILQHSRSKDFPANIMISDERSFHIGCIVLYFIRAISPINYVQSPLPNQACLTDTPETISLFSMLPDNTGKIDSTSNAVRAFFLILNLSGVVNNIKHWKAYLNTTIPENLERGLITYAQNNYVNIQRLNFIDSWAVYNVKQAIEEVALAKNTKSPMQTFSLIMNSKNLANETKEEFIDAKSSLDFK